MAMMGFLTWNIVSVQSMELLLSYKNSSRTHDMSGADASAQHQGAGAPQRRRGGKKVNE
jgi:hypothetical protein